MNSKEKNMSLDEIINACNDKIEEIKSKTPAGEVFEGDDIKEILNYIHEHPDNLKDFIDTIKQSDK